MVRFPHEPTDKQIERWYNKMSPRQKAQLDREVAEFKAQLAEEEARKKNAEPWKVYKRSDAN